MDLNDSAYDIEVILDGTSQLSTGLETLKAQNESMIQCLSSKDHTNTRKSEASVLVDEEKRRQLESSLSSLNKGITDVKFLLVLANYLSDVETDRHKLQAQVKRLCEENNWLSKELEEAQKQLQEAEVELAQLREEKEGLEFKAALVRDDIHGAQASQLTTRPDLSFDMDTTDEDNTLDHSQSRGDKSSSDGDKSKGSQDSLDKAENTLAEKLRTLHSRVMQHIHQGHHEVAATLCKRTIKELEANGGHFNQDIATVLSILAIVYKDQGKYKEATDHLKDALAVREKVAPDNKPALAAILNNLAVVRAKAGNYREAEGFCRRALEIRQKVLGANHPDVAKQLANLAVLCQNLGKYEEVEWYYQRALEIYQTELGPEDPNVARTKNLLANCYLKQGKYKAAEILFKEILQTVNSSEQLNDSDHTMSAHTPTGTFQNQWMIESGSPRLQERKLQDGDSKEASYTDKGGWHRSDRQGNKPSVSETLKNLSELCRRQGKSDAATVLAQLATSSRKGLDPEQKAKVEQVLDQPDKGNNDDGDDNHSVVSQPAASTTRRSPSPVVMRRESSGLVSGFVPV
jgi:kinesin light chain